MSFVIRSPAFSDGGEIPTEHTCDAEDVSPALEWSGAPTGTKTFALVVHDPDAPDPAAPKMDYVHWILYDIPASSSLLPEGIGSLPTGTREGVNDWKRTGYGGPCPPIGRHRYFFRLYALDATLGDRGELTRGELDQAMAGHVLGEAVVMGTYQRS
jgi:Raf kinase inhibitor-like YbhB/YbcL family protein